jgi:hypothetical protein
MAEFHIDAATAREGVSYSVDHAVLGKRLALLGLKDTEIATVFGISINRLMTWRVGHPEFASALAMGRELADAAVAEGMYKRAVGYEAPAVKFFKFGSPKDGDEEVIQQPYMEHIPPDPNAGKFWLTARRPDLWREQSHQAVSGTLEITGAGLSGLLASARNQRKDGDA